MASPSPPRCHPHKHRNRIGHQTILLPPAPPSTEQRPHRPHWLASFCTGIAVLNVVCGKLHSECLSLHTCPVRPAQSPPRLGASQQRCSVVLFPGLATSLPRVLPIEDTRSTQTAKLLFARKSQPEVPVLSIWKRHVKASARPKRLASNQHRACKHPTVKQEMLIDPTRTRVIYTAGRRRNII